MADTVLLWWTILCAAAAFNVAAWLVSARRLGRAARHLSAEDHATRRVLLWLSAGYVLGCAFRSVFPMIDVPRLCLHDTWISRIAIGRSVATVAELCFAAQWALLLREASRLPGCRFAGRASRTVLPLIAAAELCSWLAVLKTNNLLHALENSLWTIAAAVALAGIVSVWKHVGDPGKRVIAVAIGCGGAYLAFMTTVDVPMYFARWQADLAWGHAELAVSEGLLEVLERCVVRRDWAAWREDAWWLTPYFTLCVWMSVLLAHVPPFEAGRRRTEAGAARR
jgi:hypothetical protein